MPPVPSTLPLCSHLPQRQRWHQEEGQCDPFALEGFPRPASQRPRKRLAAPSSTQGDPALRLGVAHIVRGCLTCLSLPHPLHLMPCQGHTGSHQPWDSLYNCARQIPTPDTWHGAVLAGLQSDGTSVLSAALKPEPLHRETQQKTPLHTLALLHLCFGSSPFILKAHPSVLIAAG